MEANSEQVLVALRVGHCVLLYSARNVLLHSFKERNVLFSNFCRLMKPKRTLRSFAFFLKERAFFKKKARLVKKELKCSYFEFFATYETQKECYFLFKRTCVLLKERTFFQKNAGSFKKNECPTLVAHALMQIRSHVKNSELGSKLRAGVSCSNENPEPCNKFTAWKQTQSRC